MKQARAKRDEARKHLAAGVDPSEARKAAKAARGGEDSLEAVAREWHAKYAPLWVPGRAEKIIRRLERDVFPWLGGRPVGECQRACKNHPVWETKFHPPLFLRGGVGNET